MYSMTDEDEFLFRGNLHLDVQVQHLSSKAYVGTALFFMPLSGKTLQD